MFALIQRARNPWTEVSVKDSCLHLVHLLSKPNIHRVAVLNGDNIIQLITQSRFIQFLSQHQQSIEDKLGITINTILEHKQTNSRKQAPPITEQTKAPTPTTSSTQHGPGIDKLFANLQQATQPQQPHQECSPCCSSPGTSKHNVAHIHISDQLIDGFKTIYDRGVTGLAVVDERGKLVGSLSASDLKVGDSFFSVVTIVLFCSMYDFIMSMKTF
jgi:predicted transcriptional regulator